MNDTIVKRRYRSPLRESQAEATRQRILDAGLTLFAERGYPGTSIAEIARVAGVAPETIYASVGSKRGIIDALLEQVDARAPFDAAREAMIGRSGRDAELEVLADLSARFWDGHRMLVRVLRTGVADPEIGGRWQERQAGRRELIGSLVASWPPGTLRPGLDPAVATDVAWALTSDEQFHLLVDLRGWDLEAYIAWDAEALAREMLAHPRRRPTSRPPSMA